MTHAPAPVPATGWQPWTAQRAAEVFEPLGVRWWLSGGAALDRWLGRPIRERLNVDVSTLPGELDALRGGLPDRITAWVDADRTPVPLADLAEGADPQPVLLHDADADAWVARVNVEDGTDRAWVYRRDPHLQLPWDRAVLDVDGIPTGAPAVQLVWKALRPRPEDDLDKDAVLPELPAEDRAWLERALLSIHPHSSWAIHVRSPFAPAKASWNRKKNG